MYLKNKLSRLAGVWLEPVMACLTVFLILASPLPAQTLQFTLPSAGGSAVSVEPGDHALVAVCFLGTECPMARSYAKTLSELQIEYQDRGVQILGVMSNVQDSAEDVREYVESLKVDFDVLVDGEQKVADQFGATRTPEVFLLDGDLRLRYHGRIDDQFAPSVARSSARQEDLRAAIEELLAGKPVSIKETTALGCIIGRNKEATPEILSINDITFERDVRPVLERNCVECHRPGEIGPFSMQRYDEVVGWVDTMLETIEDKRMPPWHASPDFGSFANARFMPQEDTDILRAWIDGGSKRGKPTSSGEGDSQHSGAADPQWQLPTEPDLVFDMRSRPFTVPRSGVVEYQYFVVDPGFTEDKWVRAAQLMPGARDVVHHAIAFVRPPDGSQFRGLGWLAGYVPGQRLQVLPPGHARKIPAGSKFVFQMHYTPSGVERQDTSRVGIVFAEESEVTHEVLTLLALEQDFEIPPESNNHIVSSEIRWFPKDGALLAVSPHMHYRGKSFQVATRTSQGDADDESGSETTQEIQLLVPNYDFNWQHTYQFKEPVALSGVAGITIEAAFDNSAENPFNPDPTQWVTWGDQTWEEMAVAFFEVAVPLTRTPSAAGTGSREAISKERQEKIDAYVKRVLTTLDKNGDGLVEKSESAIVVRFNFDQWDPDADGIASRDEIRQVAESLFR